MDQDGLNAQLMAIKKQIKNVSQLECGIDNQVENQEMTMK